MSSDASIQVFWSSNLTVAGSFMALQSLTLAQKLAAHGHQNELHLAIC
jgi:hypothetical protein